MPKRADINSVLVIGAGPIVIGQACEFDYSGTQACRALREEGVRVVLLNSNPATIMTDPALADATYIEPVDAQSLQTIMEKEQVDAVLPTMGGQTALNCAMTLAQTGAFGAGRRVDGKPLLIGASAEAIHKAEDREAFKQAMENIGLRCAPSAVASDLAGALAAQKEIGFPIILRPSFTLGGAGGGIAYNLEEFQAMVGSALAESPNGTALLERSLIGWKEFEMEVVRDKNDNCIIVCSIENVDAMGVHTGDSITVAPAQTLTDREYQMMRDASLAVLREIGVETGGSNVQFAINPANGDMVVIEMNPRVSRSSALASKATGFPIAKVATRLALGYTLDEVANDITQGAMPASFEPSIDYIVTKAPRFDFAKFAPSEDKLSTQMRSVGEAMAIGGTFAESLQKALRGLDIGMAGLESRIDGVWQLDEDGREAQRTRLMAALSSPHSLRIFDVGDAFRVGMTAQEVHGLSHISLWFLREIEAIVACEREEILPRFSNVKQGEWEGVVSREQLLRWKRLGFSDAHIGRFAEAQGAVDGEGAIRATRYSHGIHPVYKRIDTCAGEFPTETAYLYSTYEQECELRPSDADNKIVILGSGPNRIGQGIEFDYCCVHAVQALREAGFETLMVNCNPETVSTDYDTADRLFFEPLTAEDVLEIIRREKPRGVIVQFGGQTPLSLAGALSEAGAPIIGTSVDAIDAAESRDEFKRLLEKCGLRQPQNAVARAAAGGLLGRFVQMAAGGGAGAADGALKKAAEEGLALAAEIGYPIVARPSYVLGGRAMQIVFGEGELRDYFARHASALAGGVLLDKFLHDAVEVDVDAVRDAEGACLVAGVMEHVERAGIHSGDSACALPPYSLPAEVVAELQAQTRKLADALEVAGLMNVQFAIANGDIYVLEVNPRASRTAPFVSKATGVAVAKIAALAMAGKTLREQGVATEMPPQQCHAVKEAVFPFGKFPAADVLLGPEMKSTGESMGIGADFATAYFLAQEAILPAPSGGRVVFSVRDEDKAACCELARGFVELGFEAVATRGTAAYFAERGVAVQVLNKVAEGRPHIVDAVKSGEVVMVINTEGATAASRTDSVAVRRAALSGKVVYFTTMAASAAMLRALRAKAAAGGRADAKCLQAWHGRG